MDERESILGAIYEDDNFMDGADVEMLDVEEGEFVEHNSRLQNNLEQSSGGDFKVGDEGSQRKIPKRRANKKKNKRKRTGLGPNVTDINRFVSDTCKHLKERKSYMVYSAVGCLGVSELSDFVKEVEAIQACGGQMTADGRRARTGGGILWKIIKARAPGAYNEIMKKTKEFEKQFRQQNNRETPQQIKEDFSQKAACTLTNVITASTVDISKTLPYGQFEQLSAEGKRKSVHDRIRMPVSYDDLFGEDPSPTSDLS